MQRNAFAFTTWEGWCMSPSVLALRIETLSILITSTNASEAPIFPKLPLFVPLRQSSTAADLYHSPRREGLRLQTSTLDSPIGVDLFLHFKQVIFFDVGFSGRRTTLIEYNFTTHAWSEIISISFTAFRYWIKGGGYVKNYGCFLIWRGTLYLLFKEQCNLYEIYGLHRESGMWSSF